MSNAKPSGQWWSRLHALCYLSALVLVALCFSSTAQAAFTPSSSPLLSASAVTPNVMLLVDDSGSMNSVIRAAAFDQTASTAQIYYCRDEDKCSSLYTMDMDSENFFVGSLSRGGCAYSGYSGLYRFNNNNNSSGTLYCLKLPDPVGNGNTRYSTRYIAYLISILPSGTTTKDYTTGSIPDDFRISVAREAATKIVKDNRSLRIGLATYNSPVSGNSGPGGYIAREISDLQASSTTTTAQANSNYSALLDTIDKLGAVANTPLAETYYEVTRYMRGLAPFYNNTPSTYTSPIQYRCQKNYGVVITDGLPTYDRTFPASDPAYTSTQKLPDWDNSAAKPPNNDGDNLNGDGEGDTLYLDDVAKFAYDIDMRSSGTDLAGKSWDAIDFTQQNMLTFTVGFTSTQDMLSDAAVYGHGSYYQASDAATLSTALSAALSSITSKAGSGSGGAASSASLTTDTTYYQSLYNPADWRGTLNAYPVNSDGSLSSQLTWSTDNTVVPGSAGPTFQSYNTTSTKVISLSFDNFSADQKKTLNANLPTSVTGAQLVEWTKGTNRTGLRQRTVLLGDIINSPVVYAGPNDHTATDTATDNSYSTYLYTKSSGMSAQVLVNGNDGFTNVIEAASGKRLYAYLPSSTLPLLYTVADTGYINGTSHTFLNDGQINVADVQIGGGWKTVAFTGTGAGGKTFSAIQLYDATAGNAINALWEISAPTSNTTTNAFNDLGYAYAKPEVARLPDGRWAAFIANGYGSNSGVAALYVVNVADGSLITKLVVNSSEKDNGLSSVKLSVDANSTVIAAYGGDLKGRMWKFDLSSTALTSWGLAFSGKPLFTAPGGTTQPITAQPYLLKLKTGGRMVYFGTGKFIETADKSTTYQQGFYAVRDIDGATGNYTTANLTAQAITGTFVSSGSTYMTTSTNTVDYTSKMGWNLPLTYGSTLVGERVIFQATYSYGRIIFTTAGVDISDPCSSQGFGRLVILDAVSGGMLTTATLDTNGDGVVSSTDLASSGKVYNTGYSGTPSIIQAADGSITAIGNKTDGVVDKSTLTGVGGSNRVMWRQIQ